ncbi:glycosyltransferase family 4 protein [Thermodesulfobacteriota bacterium]
MKQNERYRLLFLTIGYSIHAYRRIKIFTDDSNFDVMVVSPHDYDFTNAINIKLLSLTGGILNNKIYGLIQNLYRLIHDSVVLKKAVRQFDPQLIFLQTLLYPSYLSYLLKKAIPLVITFWNGDLLWEHKRNILDRFLKKYIVLHGLKRSAAITVNSNEAYNTCLSRKIDSNKVNLIPYPGVERSKFYKANRRESRQALNIDSDKIILCPRGTASYLNNDVILKSAKEVIKKYPDLTYVFTLGNCDPAALKTMKAYAQENDIEENIIWEKSVSWEEMPLYYNSADLMISISLKDSLPNCMIEAMACGTPVLMGDIPSIRHWLTDSQNGFLVPPRDTKALTDKIIRFFNSPALYKDKFEKYNNKLINKEFDANINIKKIKNLVLEIAQHQMG